MEKNNGYSNISAMNRFGLVTSDMFYNLIMNMQSCGMSFYDLADMMGITLEEVEILIDNENKDFSFLFEAIEILKQRDDFVDYSRLSGKLKARKAPMLRDKSAK